MIFKIFEPHPSLKPFVHSIQITETEKNQLVHQQKIVPYGFTGLFFNYKDPCIQTDAVLRTRLLPPTFVAGLYDQPFAIDGTGEIGNIAVNFYPTGLFHFLRTSTNELSNATVYSGDFLGSGTDQLLDRLRNTHNIQDKINIVEQFLLFRFSSYKSRKNEAVETAQQLLIASNGTVKIQELVAKTGVSISKIERNFRRQVGLTPKAYANILRFNHVFKLLKSGNSPQWQDVVYECGYYDQAHFIKEFQRFSGETPFRFFSASFRASDYFSGK